MQATESKPVNWSETLRSDDKNPYGTYLLHESMSELFPHQAVKDIQYDVYNFTGLHSVQEDTNAGYIIIAPKLELAKEDVHRMIQYVSKGNSIFLSGEMLSTALKDSLGIHIASEYFIEKDSSRINFKQSPFRAEKGYTYKAFTIDHYFDTLKNKFPIQVIGEIEQNNRPNYIRIQIGKGILLLHPSPLCFSNDFLLHENNSQYIASTMSYMPGKTGKIYWDQYYSHGRDEATTPFRFLLSNYWLRIAFYLAAFLLLFYILFRSKRRQRIIPVINPPRNTTIDFIQTISALYFNQKGQAEIAEKKKLYWLEYIRKRFQIDTQQLGNTFIEQLHEKSGAEKALIQSIIHSFPNTQEKYSNHQLRELSNYIQSFYQQTKHS